MMEGNARGWIAVGYTPNPGMVSHWKASHSVCMGGRGEGGGGGGSGGGRGEGGGGENGFRITY